MLPGKMDDQPLAPCVQDPQRLQIKYGQRWMRLALKQRRAPACKVPPFMQRSHSASDYPLEPAAVISAMP